MTHAVNGSPGALLTRHFLRRFLDNDLLSPSADSHQSAVFVVAFLAVSGLWASATLVLKSTSPWVSPFGVLLAVMDDKTAGLAASMVVTALATVLEWDALGLDRRDWVVLGPLPISPRSMVRAKVRALTLFVLLFALAMNALPALLYPPLQAGKLPIGMAGTLWLMLVHLFVSLGACAFGFLTAFLLRETVRALLPPRAVRRVLPVLQFLAVLVLACAFLLIAVSKPHAGPTLDRGGRGAYLSPPLWFLGAYETAIGPVVRSAPALGPTVKRQFWTQTENAGDKAAYVGRAGRLRELGGIAVAVMAVQILLGLALLAVNRRLAHAGSPAPPRGRSLRRAAGRVAAVVVVRHPASQAGFFFTLQTLGRSPSHRAYVAASLAVGLAFVVMSARINGLPLHRLAAPNARLLALQLVLAFSLVAGLRSVFAIPAEWRANWVFRYAWARDWRHYAAGVRRAIAVGVVLPLLLALFPLHAAVCGYRTAAAHFVVGWLASCTLSEFVLLGLDKLPFTCSYAAKGTLKTRWPWYLLAFLTFTYGLAWVEARSLTSTKGIAILVASLATAWGSAAATRAIRHRAGQAIVFDASPEDATQRLGLMPG